MLLALLKYFSSVSLTLLEVLKWFFPLFMFLELITYWLSNLVVSILLSKANCSVYSACDLSLLSWFKSYCLACVSDFYASLLVWLIILSYASLQANFIGNFVCYMVNLRKLNARLFSRSILAIWNPLTSFLGTLAKLSMMFSYLSSEICKLAKELSKVVINSLALFSGTISGSCSPEYWVGSAYFRLGNNNLVQWVY